MIFRAVTLSLAVSGMTGCIDRELCHFKDHPHTGLVKTLYEWKSDEWQEGERPRGMSCLLVGDGVSYSHDTIGVYKVLTGDYGLISYNGDAVNASFRNTGDIASVEAYTDVLGGMTREPGVIFRDMATCTVSPDDTTTVRLTPTAVVKGINLTVRVEGLEHPGHVTGIDCLLRGCATAVNLVTRERNKVPATIPFSMERISAGDTDFISHVTTFGPVDDGSSVISLDLQLYTGGTVTFPFDLSDYLRQADEKRIDVVNCSLTVRIKRLGISTGDTEGDVSIEEWGPGVWDTLR